MNAQSRELVGYFGFGSLVNKKTLRTSYIGVVPASLKGWRRHWQARTRLIDEDVALLSIHRDPDCIIMGMLVIDLAENMPLVDEREAGYTRNRLSRDDLALPDSAEIPDDLFVYVADEAKQTDTGSLLQSYLDAVMQGFLHEYGEAGVSHFVDTTTRFERGLIRDRNNPLYPRSVSLNAAEAALFDRELERAGVL